MTNQPKWKLIAQLGDVNPLDYGGYFIYKDETGVYTEEGEILVPPENEGGNYMVYRFILDKCTHIDGILSDNESHPEVSVLWDIDKIASFVGQPRNLLIDSLCSNDVIARAMAYRDIGEYNGFENLDSYPLTLSRAEVDKRYTGEY